MTLTEALIFNTEQNRVLGKWRNHHPPALPRPRLQLRPTDCPSHCLPLSLRSFPLPIIPLCLSRKKRKEKKKKLLIAGYPPLKRKTGDEWWHIIVAYMTNSLTFWRGVQYGGRRVFLHSFGSFTRSKILPRWVLYQVQLLRRYVK